MQWLIDMIIEAIGVPPCYVDRGADLKTDFGTVDWTQDGAWHEFDLSDIIDPGATAVAVRIVAQHPNVEQVIRLKNPIDPGTAGRCCLRTQAADVQINTNPVIGCSPDRKILYQLPAAGWDVLALSIRGWWF